MTSDPTTLWAAARLTELLPAHETPPKYGSHPWRQLPGNDPRRAAAIITAAELWRQYGDEEELLTWFKDASAPHIPPAQRLTIAELNARAKPKPPHQLRAAVGWPPVAIPGRPGWYRYLVNGRQVDHCRSQTREAA
jgi:hypothetical protein